MIAKLTLDKGGRVVIPKSVRQSLRIEPGDRLAMESLGEQLILKPIRPAVGLKKEHGVWVFRSGQATDSSASDLVDKDRENRIRELMT
jgi:AbrB family looped-hinge helix DNA binding protein